MTAMQGLAKQFSWGLMEVGLLSRASGGQPCHFQACIHALSAAISSSSLSEPTQLDIHSSPCSPSTSMASLSHPNQCQPHQCCCPSMASCQCSTTTPSRTASPQQPPSWIRHPHWAASNSSTSNNLGLVSRTTHSRRQDGHSHWQQPSPRQHLRSMHSTSVPLLCTGGCCLHPEHSLSTDAHNHGSSNDLVSVLFTPLAGLMRWLPLLLSRSLKKEPEPFEAELDEEEYEYGEFEDLGPLNHSQDDLEFDDYVFPVGEDLGDDEELGEGEQQDRLPPPKS